MKKFLGLLVILMMIASNCFARGMYGERSKELLNDMYREPSKYIDFGCVGMGMFFYLDKTSIQVDQYNPPNYIIAFREIPFSINGGNHAYDNHNEFTRYKYDYKSRKMYREVYRNGDKNQPYWREVDSNPKGWKGEGDSRHVWLAEGEVAFYLAYDMNFYEKPMSKLLQEYLQTGKWKTFERK